LTERRPKRILWNVSAQEIIEQIKALPASERAQVVKYVVENDEDAWDAQIEDDVKAGRLNELVAQAEADIAAGRVKPLDEVLGNG
jgi:hypothetical protein